MILTEQKLIEMIKTAMMEHAPKMFAELTERGTLKQFAEMRAQAAMEVHDELTNLALDEAARSNKDFLERVQEHTMANKRAVDIAIAQATEFPRETNEADD
jgi:hypothetical protein